MEQQIILQLLELDMMLRNGEFGSNLSYTHIYMLCEILRRLEITRVFRFVRSDGSKIGGTR
jgi:hypothetical protein